MSIQHLTDKFGTCTLCDRSRQVTNISKPLFDGGMAYADDQLCPMCLSLFKDKHNREPVIIWQHSTLKFDTCCDFSKLSDSCGAGPITEKDRGKLPITERLRALFGK